MNLNELLKDVPSHPYYPPNACSEELGLIEYEDVEARVSRVEWNSQTTLWMMAVALLLWLVTYLMVMTILISCDFNSHSVATFTGLVHWYNGTSVATTDDQTTRLILS